MKQLLTFDIGGTAVKYALCSEEGALSKRGSFPTPREGLFALSDALRGVLAAAEGEPVCGIAISAPGAVDPDKGEIGGISSVPYIHQIPLVKELSKALENLPVSIENDANCAALGELWQGAARGCRDFMTLVCGTGVGGAVIKNGAVHRGAHMGAGEFGSFPIVLHEGGWQTWSSCTVVNMARRYSQTMHRPVDGKELVFLAREGEPLAVRLMQHFYSAMARGCFILQFCFDPERILFGGGVSADDGILAGIRSQIERFSAEPDFVYNRPKLQKCAFGNDANLLGAAFHFLQRG